MAESIRIDDGSCEEALNFYNRLNMLFYFPDILADLVFIDPQILLDKVTGLVEESYHMRLRKKKQPLWPIQGDRLKFRNHRQVTEKFLTGFKSHFEASLFTQDVYFMPCLLQVVSLVARYQVRESSCCPFPQE